MNKLISGQSKKKKRLEIEDIDSDPLFGNKNIFSGLNETIANKSTKDSESMREEVFYYIICIY